MNFKTENGSRLITEYYAITIRVDEVNFLHEKFGVSARSACSRISTVCLFLKSARIACFCFESIFIPTLQTLEEYLSEDQRF